MSAAKHTPGPWYVSKRNPLRVIESGPRALTLATVGTNGHGVTAEGAQAEAEANARLIAAAPELLDALRDAMQAVEVFHGPIAWEVFRDHSPEMKRWRAAIAKATGEAA